MNECDHSLFMFILQYSSTQNRKDKKYKFKGRERNSKRLFTNHGLHYSSLSKTKIKT